MGWSSKASLKESYVKADLEKVMKENESVRKARERAVPGTKQAQYVQGRARKSNRLEWNERERRL